MWDTKYDTTEYIYGKKPNDFLHAHSHLFPSGGRILCLAEGEGRNSVYLAQQGYRVTGVDASSVGLHKAGQWAQEQNVTINFVHSDLSEYDLGHEQWDGIVSIFCHLPPVLRQEIHQKVVAGLKKSGILLLEAYTPKQIQYGTGGPPTEELMMSHDSIAKEFKGLHFEHLKELEREVVEGSYHSGLASVVQAIGRKV